MQQDQCPVACLGGGIDGLDELEHFVFVEVFDFRLLDAGRSHLVDPATALQMLGSDGADVARKCLDRGQPLVAGARAAVPLRLQPAEERTDDFDIEDRVIELVDVAFHPLCGVAEEKFEDVTVGQHRVGADVALRGEVLLEEVLDELRESDDCGLGGFHDSTSSRALV